MSNKPYLTTLLLLVADLCFLLGVSLCCDCFWNKCLVLGYSC